MFGSTVDALKAFCWKIRCPPKIKYFLWQLVTWCIAVKKNLKARGIQGDICCVRCRGDEESINHVFFECPPELQVWAFSKIPPNSATFPTSSLFTNMDHLFWRVSHIWMIISVRGYYGIFGNKGIIIFLIIWTLILGTCLNWQKQNQHSGLSHKY